MICPLGKIHSNDFLTILMQWNPIHIPDVFHAGAIHGIINPDVSPCTRWTERDPPSVDHVLILNELRLVCLVEPLVFVIKRVTNQICLHKGI